MLDQAEERPRRGRPFLFSALLHALLGGLLVVSPLAALPELPAEPDPRLFQPAPPPVPEEPIRVSLPARAAPAGGRGKGAGAAGPAAPAARWTAVTVPASIPDSLPAPSEPQEGEGEVTGEPDGPDVVGGARGEGIGGGEGEGEGDGSPIRAVGPDVAPPVLLHGPDPVYPEAARVARLSGPVVLEAVIGTDGSVRAARVIRAAHPILEKAAVDAVHRWRFEPARVAGRPVPVYLTLTVTFHLR